MSQIRTAKVVDLGAFPGSKFVITDTPPITQCQESLISDPGIQFFLGDNIVFANRDTSDIDLTGKEVTIQNSPSDDGLYNILKHVGTNLTIDHIFIGNSGGALGSYHDVGEVYLTRNQTSFRKFIENEGKAHTTKGGQLYTDLTDPPMDDACSDLFNPN